MVIRPCCGSRPCPCRRAGTGSLQQGILAGCPLPGRSATDVGSAGGGASRSRAAAGGAEPCVRPGTGPGQTFPAPGYPDRLGHQGLEPDSGRLLQEVAREVLGMPFHWRSSLARPSPASWLPVCRPPSRWPRPTTTLPTISPTCCTAAARSGSIPIRTSSVCSWAGRSRTSSPSVPVSLTDSALAPTPEPRSSPGSGGDAASGRRPRGRRQDLHGDGGARGSGADLYRQPVAQPPFRSGAGERASRLTPPWPR